MKPILKTVLLLAMALLLALAALSASAQSAVNPSDGTSDWAPDAAAVDHTESPAPAQALTVEALTEGYFNVLSGLESGTAGASLKTAIAASEVCAFAQAHALYAPDVESLRANMRAAFEAMRAEDRAAFWQGFDAVRALLDDCLEDWETVRPQFEDAGVAAAMDGIMADPLNRLAWENLRDHTLTMGNDTVAG